MMSHRFIGQIANGQNRASMLVNDIGIIDSKVIGSKETNRFNDEFLLGIILFAQKKKNIKR